jgi:hypothetical protein
MCGNWMRWNGVRWSDGTDRNGMRYHDGRGYRCDGMLLRRKMNC